jgi:hypothetical protein
MADLLRRSTFLRMMLLGSAGVVMGSPLAIVEPAVARIGQTLRRLIFGRKNPRYRPGGKRTTSVRFPIASPGIWVNKTDAPILPELWSLRPTVIYSKNFLGRKSVTLTNLKTCKKNQVPVTLSEGTSEYGILSLTEELEPDTRYEIYIGDFESYGNVEFKTLDQDRRLEIQRKLNKLEKESKGLAKDLSLTRISFFLGEGLYSDMLGEISRRTDDPALLDDILKQWYADNKI